MKLLLVAADPMEFRGLLKHARNSRRLSIGADWAHTGILSGHEILLVANGVGRSRAAAAVDLGLRVFAADRVISTGFCGALDPALRIADIVVATGVSQAPSASLSPDRQPRCYPALSILATRPARAGFVCSLDRVARTAAEKCALRKQGASVVEMEAAGVAERAQALGLPFSCVRVVTDLAGEDMANDFNQALRSDGHFATMRIFGNALRHPAARIPELIRLQQRCSRAARTLGDFFANCRF